MTSTFDQAREAQEQALADSPEFAARTKALYGAIEALDWDQRLLLVSQALRMAHGLLEDVHDSQGAGPLSNGLIALAGLANQGIREESGSTTTADSKVDAVLDEYRSICRDMALSAIPPEERAQAEQFAAEMKELVQGGLPFEKALDVLAQRHPEMVTEVVETAEKEPEPSYGLYL